MLAFACYFMVLWFVEVKDIILWKVMQIKILSFISLLGNVFYILYLLCGQLTWEAVP